VLPLEEETPAGEELPGIISPPEELDKLSEFELSPTSPQDTNSTERTKMQDENWAMFFIIDNIEIFATKSRPEGIAENANGGCSEGKAFPFLQQFLQPLRIW